MDDEQESAPMELTTHLVQVATAARRLRGSFPTLDDDVSWDAIVTAARWHDVGKSHPAFVTAIRDSDHIAKLDPDCVKLWAKSGGDGRLRYRIETVQHDGTPVVVKRPGFRHELASALAWLAQHSSAPEADLIAFLIAAHHGKVRQSLRSLPTEQIPPDPAIRFARGIWDGDSLPAVELGDGERSEPVMLRLEIMELGSHNGQPSWLARVLQLRDEFGPFRLSFLESLVRAADWRVSAEGVMPHGG